MEEHRETFYKNRSRKIVVFIHGITESPNQFKELNLIAIKNGYSYLNILLPGHGKNPKEFAKNGYKQWIDYINKKLDDLRKDFDEIVLVGHSMGGLLSIDSYFYNKKNITKFFLLAIPFNIKLKFNIIVKNIFILFRIDRVFNFKINTSFSTGIPNIFEVITWLPRYIDLFFLSYKIKRKIYKIDVPTIYIQSYKDELVGIKSAITLKRILSKKSKNKNLIIILKNSGHFDYLKEDKDVVFNSFTKLLKK